MKRHLSSYSKKEVARLLKLAKKSEKGVTGVSHLLPRAYCLAKPASHCAVFAVPPKDREPQVKNDETVMVQNESAALAQPGQWHSLAYVCRPGSNGLRVIE